MLDPSIPSTRLRSFNKKSNRTRQSMAIQSKIWHAEFRIYGQSNRNCSEAKQLGWNFFLHQYNWDPNEAIGKPIPIIICGREIGMEYCMEIFEKLINGA
jgi:hypothetical protein